MLSYYAGRKNAREWMEPVRVVEYKGQQIQIFVLPPVGIERTFRAIYEIRRTGSPDPRPRGGVIAGAITTAQAAEEAALEAAMKAIDDETA